MSAELMAPGLYLADKYDGMVVIVGADDSVAVMATSEDMTHPAVIDYGTGQSKRLVEGTWQAVPAKVIPLDAIVIRRDELPEVTASPLGQYTEYVAVGMEGYKLGDSSFDHARIARAHLAIVEHEREHPPVDKAQVDAISAALIEVEMDHPDGPMPGEVARRLVAAGYRIERVGGNSDV